MENIENGKSGWVADEISMEIVEENYIENGISWLTNVLVL